jgi:hypothetical protein
MPEQAGHSPSKVVYWGVDTFAKYLGGFLFATKGVFIDGNKIIE